MKSDGSIILIFTILALHFVVGIGWLLYKMAGPKKSDKDS
jgi:hypothetical protein